MPAGNEPDEQSWTSRDMEVLTALASELGGVVVWEAEAKDGSVEFVRGQIMKLTKTMLPLPDEEPVVAIGVEIGKPNGERRFSFAVSLDDLHRALVMASG
jgi:hypothetical protein